MRHTTGTLLCNHGSYNMERRSLGAIDAAVRRFDCPTVRHQRVTFKELLCQMTLDGMRIPVAQATMNGIHFV